MILGPPIAQPSSVRFRLVFLVAEPHRPVASKPCNYPTVSGVNLAGPEAEPGFSVTAEPHKTPNWHCSRSRLTQIPWMAKESLTSIAHEPSFQRATTTGRRNRQKNSNYTYLYKDTKTQTNNHESTVKNRRRSRAPDVEPEPAFSGPRPDHAPGSEWHCQRPRTPPWMRRVWKRRRLLQ